ncbi:class I SAM-dependent DNA methyltransferase [Streptomyces sp. NPDC021093]|uniref:class I SAM-dependent DNA methyltransferase n=1 Tax=Streptomyces sp. NPDC021093 TaxID=3365112 RepID=UPI003787F358
MSSKQYDQSATVYDDSLNVLTYARHAEDPTYRSVIGDVTGRSVLDLGAGTGIWTRRIKQSGADRVEGLEISAAMVAVAQEKEDAEPLGIRYHVADAASGGRAEWTGQFDVVTGINVLHYSSTPEELAGMCATAAHALRPGGRLVATCANWDMGQGPAYYEPYGIHVEVPTPRTEGAAIPLSIRLGGRQLSLQCFLWKPSTYERALTDAGFSTVAWHPWQITDEGVAQYGAAYWKPFTDMPPMLLLEATR